MYATVRRWLYRLSPENAHAVGMAAAQLAQTAALGSVRRHNAFVDATLGQRLVGLNFRNPIGLAAGVDKNAKLLPFWDALGFGFVEVGSVTAQASQGNPRPRAFRLPEDRAIINRLGLPNQGAVRVSRRIERIRRRCQVPVGISLAKTHDDAIVGSAAVADYCRSYAYLAPLADYVAINVSCPNTIDGKTFEDPRSLDILLTAILKERGALHRKPPIFLKISPPPSTRVVYDSQVEEILAVGHMHGVSGYIAGNTATYHKGLRASPQVLADIGPGGLSGPPLWPLMMQLIRYLFARLGRGTPIIGVGGVDSVQSAYRMLRAGASLIQMYTALVYEGPGIVRRIKEGLSACCERDRLGSISEAIGIDV